MKSIGLSCKGKPRLLGLLFGMFRRTVVVVAASVTWQRIAVARCFEGYMTRVATLKLE